MLSQLHIRGFKSLQDSTIELGAVNVFIGANGSGKSNILEALGVFSAAASSTVNDESVQRRGVRPGLPTLYKSSFKHIKTPPDIFLEGHSSGGVVYKVSLNNPIEKPAKSWEFKTESMKLADGTDVFTAGVKSKWRNKEIGLAATSLIASDVHSEEVTFLRLLQDYCIYTPNTDTLRGLSPDSIRGAIGIHGGGLAESLEKLLNSQSESEYRDEAFNAIDWIEDVTIQKSASMLLSPSVTRQQKVIVFQDKFMNASRNKLTAYDASEGALYILLAFILSRSPDTLPLFAVDNFDQALNPILTERMMKLFCRWMLCEATKPRQALLTVHNPAALDGLPINDDRIRLFAVDRDSTGVTRVSRQRITPELQQLANQHGWPLSRLWVMGHLGGIPND